MKKELFIDISKYSNDSAESFIDSPESNCQEICTSTCTPESFYRILRVLTRNFYKNVCSYEKIQALKTVFIKLDPKDKSFSELITEWFNELILYFNEDGLIFSTLERVDNCPQNSIMVSLLGEKIDTKIHSPLYSRINSLDSGSILISRSNEKIYFKLPLDGSPAKPDKYQ